MPSWQEEIKAGQGIWTDEDKNGKIIDVDWENQMIFAEHYRRDNTVVKRCYEFDEITGNYDERLNQWIIVPLF